VSLILRLVIWLILAYRRWISGRGPLRNVRCSFAPEDSCSAFGLRAARSSPTARIAIGRILRRIGRCRDACLLTDGRALSWMEAHDRPPAMIVAEMTADGEARTAVLRMLHARQAVAIWRADRQGIHDCAHEIEALRARDTDPRIPEAIAPVMPPPRVCSHPAVQQRARRRLIAFGVLALVALAVVGVQPWIGGLALGLTATAGTVSARTTLERSRRFELHRTWAQRR
jgi:putative component of membrane protein insertase Oxa1/YidC/SpoIIIJ protein YidD